MMNTSCTDIVDSGASGQSSYIRFSSGHQFTWETLPGNAAGIEWNLPAFFLDANYIVTGGPTFSGAFRGLTVDTRAYNKASLKMWAWVAPAFVASGVAAFAEAKGKWKDPDYPVIARFDEIHRTKMGQVQAFQAALFTGENYFGTAGGLIGSTDPGNEAWVVEKYDADYTLIARINTQAFTSPAGSHRQVNGLHYDRATDYLYVCANNYQNPGGTQSSDKGWVFVVNATTGALVSSHGLGNKLTEAVFPWCGDWWEVNASAWEIRRFDASWSLLGTYALPGGYTGDGIFGQGIFVIDGIFYVNDHGAGNVGKGRLRAYRWTGGGFVAVAQDLRRPNANCSQGVYYDGEHTWWGERHTGVGSHLVKATA